MHRWRQERQAVLSSTSQRARWCSRSGLGIRLRAPALSRQQAAAAKQPSPRSPGKTHPLEDLLPPDILQTATEVLDALDNVGYLVLVLALNLAGFSDRQVEVQPDAVGVIGEPSAVALVRRPEADAVLAGVRCRESEPALVGALLVHDPVVVVKRLVDRYEQR